MGFFDRFKNKPEAPKPQSGEGVLEEKMKDIEAEGEMEKEVKRMQTEAGTAVEAEEATAKQMENLRAVIGEEPAKATPEQAETFKPLPENEEKKAA